MKYQVKFPAILYFIWYLIILVFQIFLQPAYKLTVDSQTLYQRLYLSWASYWDSGHYATIAEKGYQFPQQAFFPLWPLVIKIASFPLGSTFAASFILSFIFGLTSFVLFYMLADKLMGKSNAQYALIIFAAFPSTMFLHAGYTEGLFLTLVLLSFILLEKRSYFLSAVVAGLTTSTRLAGIGLAAVYFLLKQSISKKLTFVSFSVIGLIFYILYLHVIFGNGLLFLDAQKAWCEVQGRCQFIFPLSPLLNYGYLLIVGKIIPSLSFVFLDWLSSVVFLILLAPVFKKLNINYFIYSLIVILIPLFSSTVGMVRYVLAAFPVFFVIPLLIRSKLLFFLICLLLALLELRFVTLFTNRIWVA